MEDRQMGNKLTHLEYIDAPIDKLRLGFNKDASKYINWQTYLSTWAMIDEGETEITNLPLYQALSIYYDKRPLKRRKYEAELLEIDSVEGSDIAYHWVERHIELYQSIKEHGYKPELRHKPLTVNITDRGILNIVDGNHTVSILKHLGYTGKLRFKVDKRHEDWIQLKQQLYDMYDKKLLYQPVYHPDFDDWDIDRACEDRWKLIEPSVDFFCKNVLDIGSNMGYFCERIAEKGGTVTGIDPNETRVIFSEILADYHKFPPNNPLYEATSFETHLTDNHYDVVLLLSLIHHYIRRSVGDAFDALNLISRHCDKMVLELGVNRLPIEWYPELVLKYTEYSRYTTISDELERPIYLYEK